MIEFVTCALLLQFQSHKIIWDDFKEVKCEVKQRSRDPHDPDMGHEILLVDCSKDLKRFRLSPHPFYNDPIRHVLLDKDCF